MCTWRAGEDRWWDEIERGGIRPIGHTVALTYNLKRPVPARAEQGEAGPPRATAGAGGSDEGRAGEVEGVPFDFYSEFDSPATIEAIATALRRGGHVVHLVEANAELPAWFLTHAVDVVFNIAEGACGAHRESHVPAVLETLGIPFTGSSSLTLSLALDKAKTKQLLACDGLATPAWQLFHTVDAPLDARLHFPLIVKPNREGSAKGISRESVVWDASTLRRQVRRIHEQYHQEALVEEFIEGVELTVGVLGNDEVQALPILEIDFAQCQRSGEFFYSWRMKEYQGNTNLGLDPGFHCPARLDPEVTARVHAVAVRAHRALGCQDLSRTDIRLRRDGIPFVLEVNPLPGLDPLESNFPIMTRAAGIPYPALIHQLVEWAVARDRDACLSRCLPVASPPASVYSGRAGATQHGNGRHIAQPQELSATPPGALTSQAG